MVNDRPSGHAGEPQRNATSSMTTPPDSVGLGGRWTLACRRRTAIVMLNHLVSAWSRTVKNVTDQTKCTSAGSPAELLCTLATHICRRLRHFADSVSQRVKLFDDLTCQRLGFRRLCLSAICYVGDFDCWRFLTGSVQTSGTRQPKIEYFASGSLAKHPITG